MVRIRVWFECACELTTTPVTENFAAEHETVVAHYPRDHRCPFHGAPAVRTERLPLKDVRGQRGAES